MIRCKNCGSTDEDRVGFCPTCGAIRYGRKRLEMHQLEFLLEHVSEWTAEGWVDIPDSVLDAYLRRLEELRGIFDTHTVPAPKPAPELSPTRQPASSSAPITPPPSKAAIASPVVSIPEPVQPASPKPEPVPFDEWLLSERNIKIALWTGALLLVMAGIIFIVSKWGELSGPFKLTLTMIATGALFTSGFILHKNRVLRMAGRAVLGVAAGFLPLNFVVLHLFVLEPIGFPTESTWLVASCICIAAYLLLAQLTGFPLFTVITIAAIYSAVTAVLAIVHLTWHPAMPLVYGILALSLLAAAKRVEDTAERDLWYWPLVMIAQTTAAICTLASLAWLSSSPSAGLWWETAGGFVGVLFYAASDLLLGWQAARWAAVTLVSLTFGITLTQSGIGDAMSGAGMLLLALIYQGTGHVIERWQKRVESGLALYSNAYIVAALITALATRSPSDLTPALFWDVLVLAVATFIHRRQELAYSTVWISMLPVYLTLAQNLSSLPSQAVPLGAMGLSYAVAGYMLGRKEVADGSLPYRGGPFLTAAAFLSAAVVLLAWNDAVVAAVVLLGSGSLYLAAGLWLRRPISLFPTLIALNLAVTTIARALLGYDFIASLYHSGTTPWRILDGVYGMIALSLFFLANRLRKKGLGSWSEPLYIVAALDLIFSYMVALLDWPMAIAISEVNAISMLILAWVDLKDIDVPLVQRTPVLTYLGLGLIITGHFYATSAAGLTSLWSVLTAALSALFVVIAWVIKRGDLRQVYGGPLQTVGLALGLFTALAALQDRQLALVATASGIIGLAYLGNAVLGYVEVPMIQRTPILSYLGLGFIAIGHVYAIRAAGLAPLWPVVSSAFFALFVVIAWSLQGSKLEQVYGVPLRWMGLGLGGLTAVAALTDGRPVMVALAFGTIALVYLAEPILGQAYTRLTIKTPVASYLGLSFIAVGHFYTIEAAGLIPLWSISSSVLSALFIVIAWVLRRDDLKQVYGVPLQTTGLVFGALTALLAFIDIRQVTIEVTFGIIGLVYLAEATLGYLNVPMVQKTPAVSYLGLGFVTIGCFYAIDTLGLTQLWLVLSSGLYAIFIAIAWGMDGSDWEHVYGVPLRWTGLGLGAMTALATLVEGRSITVAIAFSIVGFSWLGEAIRRHSWNWGYLACCPLLVVYWALLSYSAVTELQLYVIPAGLALLTVDWNERRRGRSPSYGSVGLVGLAILLGSSFMQSLSRGGTLYALLLALESAAAISWGIELRSRNYVTIGALALIVSGFAQFGPGFTELPRWVQLLMTGSVLLSGAIGVLLKREQVLQARQAIAREWSRWEP